MRRKSLLLQRVQKVSPILGFSINLGEWKKKKKYFVLKASSSQSSAEHSYRRSFEFIDSAAFAHACSFGVAVSTTRN